PLSAVSDETGQYRLTALGPGLYTIEVMLDGFRTLTRKITIRAGETTVEDFRLELEALKGDVTVKAESDGVDTKNAAPPTTIAQETLQAVPLVNERFQDALPLIPGVVRGPDGLLNVKGSRASQS